MTCPNCNAEMLTSCPDCDHFEPTIEEDVECGCEVCIAEREEQRRNHA